MARVDSRYRTACHRTKLQHLSKDNSPSFITIRTTLPSPQCNGVFVLLGAKRVRWNHQCQNRNNRFKANVSRSISSTTLSCSCKWMVRMEDNTERKSSILSLSRKQHVLLMAGIYEHWGEGEQSLNTFTILTQIQLQRFNISTTECPSSSMKWKQIRG